MPLRGQWGLAPLPRAGTGLGTLVGRAMACQRAKGQRYSTHPKRSAWRPVGDRFRVGRGQTESAVWGEGEGEGERVVDPAKSRNLHICLLLTAPAFSATSTSLKNIFVLASADGGCRSQRTRAFPTPPPRRGAPGLGSGSPPRQTARSPGPLSLLAYNSKWAIQKVFHDSNRTIPTNCYTSRESRAGCDFH